ncbi:MAG: hypothetical protein HY978_00630 [Candidatus Liptonbacteria bacterium]|nr:hypothetical protein [Candidatus Liptonbacteria bacterium]
MILPYLLIFGLVATLNVVPFFMPATWTILAFISLNYDVSILGLVLTGAVAATLGRVILAKLSNRILRQRFLTEQTRKNIDDIKVRLEKHQGWTVTAFLLYAFTPFPTNYLFIAYGLTGLPLARVSVPFFLGRLVSYGALSYSTDRLAARFANDISGELFSGYFVITQILTILAVYLFTKIKWRTLFTRKKVELVEE